jgi:hypothetical protein
MMAEGIPVARRLSVPLIPEANEALDRLRERTAPDGR